MANTDRICGGEFLEGVPMTSYRILCSVFVTIIICLNTPVFAYTFAGGTGEPNDPFQIATAEQLISIGSDPNLLDKHFILLNDIDLDPNLPGGQVFTKAVIGLVDYYANTMRSGYFRAMPFAGGFDGGGHVIRHLVIKGTGYLGLFGYLAKGAEVRNLGVVDANITGSNGPVGAVAGYNLGFMTRCYATCMVGGSGNVGGLVGFNKGVVSLCYSDCAVEGGSTVGGLAGDNDGAIVCSHSSGAVTGDSRVGGLVGWNHEAVTQCYTAASVDGGQCVGGLVGLNSDDAVTHAVVTDCYSIGPVRGRQDVGGLVGRNYPNATGNCFWDIQTSGQTTSDGGTGLSTAEMQDVRTFLDAGWDFFGETANGVSETWQMPEAGGYPVLAIFDGSTPPLLQGLGTPETPYLISDAIQLGEMVYYSPYAYYRLTASIYLTGTCWNASVVPWFAGHLDGAGFTVSRLTVTGQGTLGLFGRLESGGQINDMTVEDVNISGSGDYIGGLIGISAGAVRHCASAGTVSGDTCVGGLIGANAEGEVTQCYSTCAVCGASEIGGLTGQSSGHIVQCYETGAVVGSSNVGGLAGNVWFGGTVVQCYSAGSVSGNENVGGLVGGKYYCGGVVTSFWDIEISRQTASLGGTGKTTVELQTASTFSEVDWNLSDVWTICEGQDYPRLKWEGRSCPAAD
jgi:hypothetical protein